LKTDKNFLWIFRIPSEKTNVEGSKYGEISKDGEKKEGRKQIKVRPQKFTDHAKFLERIEKIFETLFIISLV